MTLHESRLATRCSSANVPGPLCLGLVPVVHGRLEASRVCERDSDQCRLLASLGAGITELLHRYREMT